GASFPSNPSEGDLFYRSDEHRIYYFNGSEWKPVADIPTGHVKLPEPSTSDWITPDSVEASSGHENEAISEDNTVISTTSYYYELVKTLEFTAEKVYKLVAELHSSHPAVEARMLIKLYKEGSEVWSHEEITTSTEYVEFTYYPNVEADKAELYMRTKNTGYPAYNRTFKVCREFWINAVKDEDTATSWHPEPANEPGAWLKIDTGTLQITGAIRIYFPDPSYIPESFKIEASEDGTTWETLLTGQTGSEGWNTYTFNARYIRYLRVTVENYGTANGIKIAEIDYYSRVTERVAALHGHGSGVVRFRKGHGERLSDTIRREVSETLNAFRQASIQEKFTKLEVYLLLLEKRIRMLEDLTGV
ncbi:hypothetical protein DRO58_01450, partial [Candidatus Bathyarchaeota archaeon]